MIAMVDLPKSKYRVLPDHKPAPGKLHIAAMLLAIVGVSVLFAAGVLL